MSRRGREELMWCTEGEDEDEEKDQADEDTGEKVDKEQLIRGFKWYD